MALEVDGFLEGGIQQQRHPLLHQRVQCDRDGGGGDGVQGRDTEAEHDGGGEEVVDGRGRRGRGGEHAGEAEVQEHRGLVGFLHNDSDAMIICEFGKNGSLGEALHEKQGLLVDWVSRYNVALGVAQGLAYLHHDCHPLLIHRDVKSSNILLDEHLEARVADFGLAKMVLTKNEMVSMVAEYGYTLKVDEKSDVYSYGVVLMELVTGKRPLEEEFGESVDIVGWMRGKQRLEEALDASVGNTKHVQEEMMLVLRIAVFSTAKLPKIGLP